jgi:hypothetical protein
MATNQIGTDSVLLHACERYFDVAGELAWLFENHIDVSDAEVAPLCDRAAQLVERVMG